MEYFFYLSITILFIIIIILLITKIKQEKKYKDEYVKQQKEKWNIELSTEQSLLNIAHTERVNAENEFYRRKKEIDESVQQQEALANKAIVAINRRREEYEESNKDVEEQAKSALEARLQRDYTLTQAIYKTNLEEIVEELREAALAEYGTLTSSLEEQLGALQREVEEYRQKREVINAEILRQRAIDEKQDFYRVVLDQSSIDDINVLNSIRKNLHKHDSLDKLIYDTYVAKPVQEMVKRVLEGGAPSGIYKITRLKTGEIYIGKSTDVKTRWIQHTKTAFGCGTIAHSILHTTMARDGIDQFTFELLEEVPKDKLTEREKYYISFYDSKKYGLNEREG